MKRFSVHAVPVSLLLALAVAPFPVRSETGTPARAMRWAYLTDSSPVVSPVTRADERPLTGYTVAALAGFAIDRNGGLARKPSRARAFAEAAGISGTLFVPVLTFTSPAEGAHLLYSPAARARAVKEIIDCVASFRARGVHLDFEYLAPERAGDLVSFVSELRAALKAHDGACSLSMALFPQIGFPRKWAGFHDFARLAPLLDEAVLMCYDLHRRGTTPGPVVSVSWAKENVKHALRYFLPEKLWLGVPAYGYSWTAVGVEVVSARAGVRKAALHGGARHESGCLYYEHRRGKEMIKTYIADSHTRQELEILALKMGLKGTAIWRLGLED